MKGFRKTTKALRGFLPVGLLLLQLSGCQRSAAGGSSCYGVLLDWLGGVQADVLQKEKSIAQCSVRMAALKAAPTHPINVVVNSKPEKLTVKGVSYSRMVSKAEPDTAVYVGRDVSVIISWSRDANGVPTGSQLPSYPQLPSTNFQPVQQLKMRSM